MSDESSLQFAGKILRSGGYQYEADLIERLLSKTLERPKIVCLCGSSRFVDIMAVVAWLIERDERAITTGLHLLPAWYPDDVPHHLAEAEGVAEEMDNLHLRKIDLADEIYVIDWRGYIGESTSREISYAKEREMPVRYLREERAHIEFVASALQEQETKDA